MTQGDRWSFRNLRVARLINQQSEDVLRLVPSTVRWTPSAALRGKEWGGTGKHNGLVTVARHLVVLGVLETKKDGRRVWYRRTCNSLEVKFP